MQKKYFWDRFWPQTFSLVASVSLVLKLHYQTWLQKYLSTEVCLLRSFIAQKETYDPNNEEIVKKIMI